VVEVDAHDDRDVRIDDVHRVEPPAQAHLEDRRLELARGEDREAASVPNSK
jgi:hypothetical protein